MRNQKPKKDTRASRRRHNFAFTPTELSLFRCSTCHAANPTPIGEDAPKACASCGTTFEQLSAVTPNNFRSNLGQNIVRRTLERRCSRCLSDKATTNHDEPYVCKPCRKELAG